MIAALIPRTDMSPVPRVEVLVEDAVTIDGGGGFLATPDVLDGGSASSTGTAIDGGIANMRTVEIPAGTTSVTLWRVDGDQRRKVRKIIRVPYYGEKFAVQDREAGRGDASGYELECFTDSGFSTTVSLGSTVLPAPAQAWETVIQQPFNPAVNAVVEEMQANVESVTRESSGGLVFVEGESYPRLIGSGHRRALSDVKIDFVAKDRSVAAAVWRTLGGSGGDYLPVLLIRSTHPLLPRVFFCEVRSVQEVGVDLHVGGLQSRFLATVSEVAPPAPGISVPAVRYSDLAVTFGTYAAIGTALPSYSGWGSAWEYSGAAG
jgi:hypothetical protein